jgi:uncharacterized membrane protein YeiB
MFLSGGAMNGSKRRARVAALDAVRGFAIVAMIVAHAIPFTRAVTPQPVLAGEALLNDVASPLFAFVIGATLALNIGGLPRTERTRFRIQTAIKAAALIVLGFSLDLVEAHVAVVLDYLGAAMLVAIPLLFCSTRTLLAITAALCVAGPLITDAARQATFAVPGLAFPVTPITVVLDWLALGESYRVLGLLPLLLLGIVVARWVGAADVSTPAVPGDAPARLEARTRPARVAVIVAIGVALFAASVPWREIAVADGTYTSGSYPDLLRDLGLTLLAYGVITLLIDGTRGRMQRAARVVLRPLSAQGEMALSVYALHVLVLAAIWASPIGADDGGWVGTMRGWLITAALLVGCAVFAILWSRVLGTGPLERVIGVVSGRHPIGRRTAEPQRDPVEASVRTGSDDAHG